MKITNEPESIAITNPYKDQEPIQYLSGKEKRKLRRAKQRKTK
jgi:hypothetical protein